MPVRLATFLHVSDLHFGDLDPSNGDGTYDAPPPALLGWSGWPWFLGGLLGHSALAMKALAKLGNKLKQDEGAELLVTGDLTCVGKDDQFARVEQYLGNTVVTSIGSFGLSVGHWKDRCITGNHDHWNGMHPIEGGGAPQAMLNRFPAGTFPKLAPKLALSLPNGQTLALRFVMIDSDADTPWDPITLDRVMGFGRFSSHLNDPRIDMGAVGANEVRVVLIHHSRLHPPNSLSLRMRTACRRAFDAYLVRQGVSVVLTGHIHSHWLKSFVVSDPIHGNNRKVFEARSGAATQRDEIPSTWLTVHPEWGTWRLPPNTVLVHRLHYHPEPAPYVTWDSQVYRRRRGGEFQESVHPGDNHSFPVWPHP